MTLRSSDLQSDGDLDSIRNSCDVFLLKGFRTLLSKLRQLMKQLIFVPNIILGNAGNDGDYDGGDADADYDYDQVNEC